MTTIRSKRSKKRIQPIHLLLASGGVLGTLIGGNLLAGREWVQSIVPDHQTDASLLSPIDSNIPAIQAYTPPDIQLPDTSNLPREVDHPEIKLSERVVLIDQGKPQTINGLESDASNGSTESTVITLPEIPQIAVPVIPERPQVNVQSVSLDLPEIPQVQVPQPVTTSKSSK